AGNQADPRYVRPAMFYRKLTDKRVECELCPRHCQVDDGRRGLCGVRENRGGEYVTLVHGRAVALNNDPIEKKPFNHFRPGTMVLSVATAGCNIACKFCQNWQISQFKPEEVDARYLPPEELVRMATAEKIPSLACTYSEPTIYYEYMYDLSRKAAEAGIKSVVISNGFISPEAVKKLAPVIAAYKVDLKSFSEDYYRDYCSARLKPVMTTLETLMGLGPWVEIVNLVVPGANDQEKDIRAMAKWIKTNLGEMVPLHFTRFHPMYKLRNLPPTPVATLEACQAAAAAEGLKYVYIGNVSGHPKQNTYCHKCQTLLIQRTGLWSVDIQLKDGRCPACRTAIPGVWA
ncbi:MAG: AmmeMemoRadiSam system radical SAM enzyme, partial [Deltaproteobacteria bacterium]|nr:AmmeMemoRadiSam system radical SAM enzyme [Deltaproteobacteria bacterium]